MSICVYVVVQVYTMSKSVNTTLRISPMYVLLLQLPLDVASEVLMCVCKPVGYGEGRCRK